MAHRAALWCVVMLGACKGIPESDFIVEYETLYCSAYAACATDEMLRTTNERECLIWFSEMPYPPDDDCSFDRVTAELCVAELSTSGCLDEDPEVPAICDAVFGSGGLCRPHRLPVMVFDPGAPEWGHLGTE